MRFEQNRSTVGSIMTSLVAYDVFLLFSFVRSFRYHMRKVVLKIINLTYSKVIVIPYIGNLFLLCFVYEYHVMFPRQVKT